MARINDRRSSAPPKRGSTRRRKKDAALITDARGSRIRNYDHRRHVYAVLQWSRIPLLLLSGAFYMWWDLPWIAAILMVVSVPMPWIAVVIANGVGEPADRRKPRVYKPGVVREQNRRWDEQQRQQALKEAEMRALGSAASVKDTDVPPQSDDKTSSKTFDDANVIDMPEDDDPSSSSSN
ncbi:DUF3099 domain-containing protein [Corynebacterium vitaeruminis]|uniref:DUF3099 domain-containing protein n=1 Tax=Corynebacterium vitaeruminis TaxID=38305 RepID=UPI000660A6A6|nr:DUF3099 domain-containing protein [Corynebacterium vitaeruminis]